jgi:hypothetical protein
MTIPEAWLEEINRRMSQDGIPYQQRPFRALEEWTRANNCSVVFGSELYMKVQAWFGRNSPPEAHQIGSQYEGTFYYDAYFWRVSIPVAYGNVQLDPWNSLMAVPKTVMARLRSDKDAALEFIALWADCMDYGFGSDDVLKTQANSFGKRLFASGNEHIKATGALLHGGAPNAKAAESARMATEIFLKSFIAFHGGLTEEEAKKKIGHNLTVALDWCLAVHPSSELGALRSRLAQLPPVNARYDANQCCPEDLWFAYGTAQFAGSAIVRSLTDRNARAEIQRKLGNPTNRNP